MGRGTGKAWQFKEGTAQPKKGSWPLLPADLPPVHSKYLHAFKLGQRAQGPQRPESAEGLQALYVHESDHRDLVGREAPGSAYLVSRDASGGCEPSGEADAPRDQPGPGGSGKASGDTTFLLVWPNYSPDRSEQ